VLAESSVGNLASVTANQLDPNPENNQASATITVQPFFDLKMAKTVSNPSPTAGGPVTYTLLLINNGPSPATGVTITDPLPNGLSFLSANAGQGSCGSVGQTVICQLGTLAAGSAVIATVTVNIAPSAIGSTLINTASASAAELAGRPELIARPELLNSQASITPVAAPSTPPPSAPSDADLSIAKTVNQIRAHIGQSLTYSITVTNHGPATAASPTVTDTFSAPVKIVSINTPQGSCSKSGAIVCKLGSIASGASAKITIVTQPIATGQLDNTASVASPTPDPDGANNVAKVTTSVTPGQASLKLTKTANKHTVGPGQALSFKITVRSLGPEPARAVKVCDRLGSGMTFISVHGASFHGGSPCWKISSLAKGKHRSFVVRVRAPMLAGPRMLTNAASASADGVRSRSVRARVKLVGQPQPRVGGVTG
jgi:uncharacterized repeat protein (TIGR01451 family)